MEEIVNRLCRSAVGPTGAVSAAHPLASSAALRVLAAGGSAVDAAIAAQAMICVTMPQAAGLGGDMLALVHLDGAVTALMGTGLSATRSPEKYESDGGSAVTVPGIVGAWVDGHARWGTLPLTQILSPAIELADRGYRIDAELATALSAQRARIERRGCDTWPLLELGEGETWRQPELAALLRSIAEHGRGAFYEGPAAAAIAAAIARHGGTLDGGDLLRHETEFKPTVSTPWQGGLLHVQPPATQGTLLAMSARWAEQHASGYHGERLDHVLVEATEAAFAHRDSVAVDDSLLALELEVDADIAGHRGGPRAYLHTAGVATADASGMVVSSLVSVFDDFGSGVYVAELGIVLNNRAAGFTAGANAPAAAKKPVHTLAPAMLIGRGGQPVALATPGADGQVQTLLQVLARHRFEGLQLSAALASPRWRSEGGSLLIERGHPSIPGLREHGHELTIRERGDDVFGAVVVAGLDHGLPFAASDWRRTLSTGAV